MMSQGKQITHFNTRDLRGFLLRFLLSLSLSTLLTFLSLLFFKGKSLS